MHCAGSPAAAGSGSGSGSMSPASSCERRDGLASSGLKAGQSFVKSVLELAAQGRLDDATALCNARLSAMTSSASGKRASSTRALCEALSLRSSLLIKKQELQSALADAETAVALDRDYCQGYYCKAVALCEMGRYSDSLEFLQAALKLAKSRKHAEFLQQCIDLVRREGRLWLVPLVVSYVLGLECACGDVELCGLAFAILGAGRGRAFDMGALGASAAGPLERCQARGGLSGRACRLQSQRCHGRRKQEQEQEQEQRQRPSHSHSRSRSRAPPPGLPEL